MWEGSPSLDNDPDVRDVLRRGIGSIADDAERDRVSVFLEAVNASRSQGGSQECEALTRAAREAYEGRTAHLAMGWQKIILVETGLAGERLEHENRQRSHEIMQWSYGHCKAHGHSIDDIDEGTVMGHFMFNINQALIATWSPPGG